MRCIALTFVLLLAACTQPEPEVECVTHSLEIGGLVECGPKID